MLFNVVCTIIFFTLFIGFFVWLIRISRKGMSKLHSKILYLIVFGSGFILALLSWLIPFITTRNYVTVDAVITNIEKLESSAPDTMDYDYDVTFQYTYNNVEYLGHIVYQDDDQIPDTHTKLKCNPDDPTQLANFTLFWMGVVVSVIFGILDYSFIKDFIHFIRYRNKEEEDPEYDSEIQSD